MDSEIIPRFKSIKENKALTNNYGLLITIKTLLGPFLVFVVPYIALWRFLMQTMKSHGLCQAAEAISENATMP